MNRIVVEILANMTRSKLGQRNILYIWCVSAIVKFSELLFLWCLIWRALKLHFFLNSFLPVVNPSFFFPVENAAFISVSYSVCTFCTVFRDVCLLSSCFNKGPKILSTSGTADAVTACHGSVVRDTMWLECRVKRKEGGQETSGGHSGADSLPLLTSSHLTVSRKTLLLWLWLWLFIVFGW